MIRAARWSGIGPSCGRVARVVRCSSSCTAYASGYGKSSTDCNALAASGQGARPVASVTLPLARLAQPAEQSRAVSARSLGRQPTESSAAKKRASRRGQKSRRLAVIPRGRGGVGVSRIHPDPPRQTRLRAVRRRGWLRRHSCGRAATAQAGRRRLLRRAHDSAVRYSVVRCGGGYTDSVRAYLEPSLGRAEKPAGLPRIRLEVATFAILQNRANGISDGSAGRSTVHDATPDDLLPR